MRLGIIAISAVIMAACLLSIDYNIGRYINWQAQQRSGVDG